MISISNAFANTTTGLNVLDNGYQELYIGDVICGPAVILTTARRHCHSVLLLEEENAMALYCYWIGM